MKQPCETILVTDKVEDFYSPSVVFQNCLKLGFFSIPEFQNKEIYPFALVLLAFWEVSSTKSAMHSSSLAALWVCCHNTKQNKHGNAELKHSSPSLDHSTLCYLQDTSIAIS